MSDQSPGSKIKKIMFRSVRGGSLELFLGHFPEDCLLHQFAAGAHQKFFLDMCLIGFHGFHAEVKFIGYLARTVAVTDEAKDFKFAIREVSDARLAGRRSPHVLLQDFVRHAITQIDFSIENPAYGYQYFLRGFLFHDIAVGAGP